MKTGVVDWFLWASLENCIDAITQSGVRNLHMAWPPRNNDPNTVHVAGAAVSDGPLRVTAIALNGLEAIEGVLNGDEVAWRRAHDMISSGIDFAASIDCGFVYLPLFGLNMPLTDRALEAAASQLSHALEYSRHHEILIGTENILCAAQNNWLAACLGTDRLRYLVDIYNARTVDRDVPSLVSRIDLPLFNEVHVKDGRDGGLGNCRLGDGDGEVWRTLQELVASSPIDTLVLESDYRHGDERLLQNDLLRLRGRLS